MAGWCIVVLWLGLLSSPAYADFTKTITVTPNVQVNAITTWYFANCSTILGVGSFAVNVAPKHGTLSFSGLSGPIPGCPPGSPSLPAVAAFYTWTDTTSGATADYFQIYYQLNGTVAQVDDITVTLAQQPAQILFENNNITGATQNVLVGQQIALTVSLPPGASPASNNPWTIDGSIVGGFNISPSGDQPTTGQVINVAYSQSAVTFYWIGPGEFPVRYNYLLNGQPAAVSATFNVSAPVNPTVVTITGDTVSVGYIGRHLYLAFGAEGVPGISFTASSVLPPGNSGQYQWLQLLVGESEFHTKLNGHQNNCSVPSPQGALDNTYPYNSTPGENPVRDSPEVRILDNDRDVTFSLAADMYLMWNPLLPQGCYPGGQCTSIPVPLGYTSWQVSMEASRDSRQQNWSASGSGAAAPFNPLIAYPEWNSIITNTIVVTCP